MDQPHIQAAGELLTALEDAEIPGRETRIVQVRKAAETVRLESSHWDWRVDPSAAVAP